MDVKIISINQNIVIAKIQFMGDKCGMEIHFLVTMSWQDIIIFIN